MTKPNATFVREINKPAIFFPHLDGLRFFCFLSVFFFHSFHTEYDYIKNSSTYYFVKQFVFGNGNLGVNFFFVLSGFLITFLLLKEQEYYGRIHVLNFWKRRILRIWPLYFACLIFGFFIFPQIKILFGHQPNETANILYYLTFLNNFDLLKNGLPDASVLGALWSVAIEEQFYLIWPLVLIVVPVHWYKYLFLIVIFTTLCFRALFDDPLKNEYHTLSCIGDMTIGAWGALLMQSNSFRKKVESISEVYIMALYSVIVLIFLFRDDILLSSYPMRIIERSLIAIVFLMVILEQNYAKNSLFKLGKFKSISKLGTVSYGLYCLHFIGILITTAIFKILHWNTHLWQVLILETAVALGITVIIAIFSYRFFESHFLKMKHKLSSIRTPLNLDGFGA